MLGSQLGVFCIELVKMILGIENPQINERIQALVQNETSDFWDEFTIEQQAELDQAIIVQICPVATQLFK